MFFLHDGVFAVEGNSIRSSATRIPLLRTSFRPLRRSGFPAKRTHFRWSQKLMRNLRGLGQPERDEVHVFGLEGEGVERLAGPSPLGPNHVHASSSLGHPSPSTSLAPFHCTPPHPGIRSETSNRLVYPSSTIPHSHTLLGFLSLPTPSLLSP